MRTTFLCAAFVAFLPALAHAQSTASAIADFGLLGTWAGECRESASPTNNHATYASTSSGGVQLRYQAGEGYQDSIYDIVEAKRLAADRLSMRQVLIGNESVTLEIVLLKQSDRIRIWSSVFPDGTSLVEDGILQSFAGRETRWMARCP
jgi:hypothetical protein